MRRPHDEGKLARTDRRFYSSVQGKWAATLDGVNVHSCTLLHQREELVAVLSTPQYASL